jgi:hypothetical protein
MCHFWPYPGLPPVAAIVSICTKRTITPSAGFCMIPADPLTAGRRQAMDEVIDRLAFYNHKSLHSIWGYVSPMPFEQRWITAQQQDRKFA